MCLTLLNNMSHDDYIKEAKNEPQKSTYEELEKQILQQQVEILNLRKEATRWQIAYDFSTSNGVILQEALYAMKNANYITLQDGQGNQHTLAVRLAGISYLEPVKHLVAYVHSFKAIEYKPELVQPAVEKRKIQI